MAKGYLRANPSSEDSRSVCRSGANKNARLCTFRCVAWQKARLTGNLDRGGVFLRPRVNLGQRQRSRGRSVSGLNFTTNRGTFKMYNSPRDHWSNRYFETLALQRSSAEFRHCNTSTRVCVSLCVCVCVYLFGNTDTQGSWCNDQWNKPPSSRKTFYGRPAGKGLFFFFCQWHTIKGRGIKKLENIFIYNKSLSLPSLVLIRLV